MKRAALLALVVGAPLVLLLFPGLRRRILRKGRALLLLWSGAVLVVGLFALNAADGANHTAGEWVFAAGGIVLVLVAFASVLRDALRG